MKSQRNIFLKQLFTRISAGIELHEHKGKLEFHGLFQLWAVYKPQIFEMMAL